MKIGDRVFVLCGLEVQEFEVYAFRATNNEPMIRNDRSIGRAISFETVYLNLDFAVAASKAAREKAIKRCARELERLALNTGVKVTLLKSKPPKSAARDSGGDR